MTDDPLDAALAANLAAVRARITARCEACGRPAGEVLLLPATKYAGVPALQSLFRLGLRQFGENQVLAAERRAAALPSEAVFHLIGHLQRNKVKKALECFRTIQSVDSLRLAEEIERRAAPRLAEILIEINTGGEPQKHGFTAEEALTALEAMRSLEHLRIRGFMTVAPWASAPEEVRPCFRRLRLLRDEARRRGLGDGKLDVLSMGMSNDFEAAIEEGATIVRIGSALFAGLDVAPDLE